MTVATIVPNEDIHTPEIGTSTAAFLADANDLTGQYTFRNPDVKVGLSTFTLPAHARVKAAAMMMRGYNNGLGDVSGAENNPLTFLVSLRDAAGTQLAGFSPVIAGIDPQTRTSAATPIIGDQATVDGLQLWFRHTTPPIYVSIGGEYAGTEYEGVAVEASATIIYTLVPVVAVAAPSGTIITATPTLTWTFTGDIDADSVGMQQRYHVKVFDAATYGAVGFDPDTTTAVYDSGDVVSGLTSTTIGPLPNATTYKAYVRAAQNVNGAPHWSLWDDGPTFFTNTDPPYVATITASISGAAVKVRVTRDLAHAVWSHINVERSDDSGVSWRPVRGALQPVAPDDTVTVYDYEQPEGIPLRYRARGVIVVGDLVVSQGPWKLTSSPMVWTGEACGEWLRAPGDPAGAVLIEVMVDEATTTTRHRVGLLDVIGRASPVTVWDVPLLPVGVLSTVTRTYDEGVALRELVRTAPVLLWQGRRVWGHPQRWMVIVDHSVSRHPSADSMFTEYREWEISWVEVAEPPVLS